MKIVVLASRYPYPLEKGDKLRLFHQIRLLAHYHEIHLICITDRIPEDKQIEVLYAYCKSISYFPLTLFSRIVGIILGWFRGWPVHISYFYNARLKKRITNEIKAISPDLIYCQLVRMMPYTEGLLGNKWIDLMDSFSLNLRRRYSQASFLERIWLKSEAQRMAEMETKALYQFDQVSIISEQDRDSIVNPDNKKIYLLSNGVDLDFFALSKANEKTYDIAFAGNLGYEPNINAVKFLNQLHQGILRSYTFLVAGARPVKRISDMNKPGFEIRGWVDDIREVYYRAKVFVAPLFTGSGQQNKILEAMACGTPVITSSLVNKSINALPGETILIADTPEEYKIHLISLLDDPEKASRIATSARTFVENNFSWNHVGDQIIKMLADK